MAMIVATAPAQRVFDNGPASVIDARSQFCRVKLRGKADGKDQKPEKEVVVACTDTIIDPGAVVIKAFHTLIANTAMAGASRSNYLTIWAQKHWVKALK